MTKMTMSAILVVKFLAVNKNIVNSYVSVSKRRRYVMFYGN